VNFLKKFLFFFIGLAVVVSALAPLQANALPVCTIDIATNDGTFSGTSGNDVICVHGDRNTVSALEGNDSVIDFGNGNSINLGAGNDSYDGSLASGSTVLGGSGNDIISGTPSADHLRGDDGADTISGGDGADQITGDIGSDILRGDGGDDIIAGGPGVDSVDGGPGLNNCDYTATERRTTTCIYDNSAPSIIVSSFTPSQVEVGTSAATAQLSVHVSDTTGTFRLIIECTFGAALMFYPSSPNEFILGSSADPHPATTAFSGNIRDFTVVIPLVIRQGIEPRPYQCQSTNEDILGNKTSVPVAIASLKVTRKAGQWDVSPPDVLGASWSWEIGNVSNSAWTFPLLVHLKDATGVNSVSIRCELKVSETRSYSLTSDWYQSWHSDSVTVRGTPTDLTLQFILTARRGQYPGSYACFMSYGDVLQHFVIRSPLRSLLVQRQGAGFDDAPPEVAATFDGVIPDVGERDADSVLVLKLKDSTSIDFVEVQCSIMTGGSRFYAINRFFGGADLREHAANAKDFTYRVPFTIPFGSPPGSYVCTERTSDGFNEDTYSSSSGSAEHPPLVVLRTPPGMPHSPFDLTFTSELPTTGRLSWTAPLTLGSPSLFDYQIDVSTDGKNWKTIQDGVSISTSVELLNLKAATHYWFRVRGDNGGNSLAGSPGGAWSEPLQALTPNAVAPSEPTQLVAVPVSKSVENITWQFGYSGGAAITDFRLEISADAGVTWKAVSHVAAAAQSMTLRGLHPSTPYVVRVTPKNAVGYGSASTVSFTTME